MRFLKRFNVCLYVSTSLWWKGNGQSTKHLFVRPLKILRVFWEETAMWSESKTKLSFPVQSVSATVPKSFTEKGMLSSDDESLKLKHCDVSVSALEGSSHKDVWK